MTDRPILFSAPMVRALLAGTKTQTRRVLKPNPKATVTYTRLGMGALCPYGQAGDRLWVREAWARTTVFPGTEMVVYRESDNRTDYGGPWKPSIHMFRRDSRITLEITGVRVERLQDISEADAKAEGATPIPDPCDHVRLACADIGCTGPQPYRAGFRALWQSINGHGSWEANPWLWVVEFRRLP
ncbi:MAG: hypothetical protein V4739_11725 [Pseudomonadota bacterium]